MEIGKAIPDIYNLDKFEDLCNSEELNLDIVIFFQNRRIDQIYFNEINISNSVEKSGTLNISNVLKKCNIEKFNMVYKKSKLAVTAYFRLKSPSNHIVLYNQGSISQQFIEDKTFFDCIWLSELNLYINYKSFNNGDFVKIKLRQIKYHVMGRNLIFNSQTYCESSESIVLFKNCRHMEIPLYFEIIFRNLRDDDERFNNISGRPKKISIPVSFPDGKGEIICDMFVRYKTGYICYILKYILPNGEEINIQNRNQCNHCPSYTKLYDITLQSKYKTFCFDQLFTFSKIFDIFYPKKLNKDKKIEIKMEDLQMFKTVSPKFVIKLQIKD
jgi:hypothetical protein